MAVLLPTNSHYNDHNNNYVYNNNCYDHKNVNNIDSTQTTMIPPKPSNNNVIGNGCRRTDRNINARFEQ